MLLYTSSAGRSGMLLFTRVKKAIFSLEQTHNTAHQNPESLAGATSVTSSCFPPEGLDLGDLFAALSPDFVDVLGCRPHHLLHPLLLQLLLLGLREEERRC